MGESDFPSFIRIMTGVAVLLRVPLLNEDEMRIYFKYLSTKFKSIKELSEAADKMVSNADKVYDSRKEFPRVTSFLQFKEIATEQEIDLMALDAWNKALDIAIVYGESVKPVFEDALITETINRIGGWYEFHNNVGYSYSNEDLKRRERFERKFITTYKNIVDTGAVTGKDLICAPKKELIVKSEYEPLNLSQEAKQKNLQIASDKTKNLLVGKIKKI